MQLHERLLGPSFARLPLGLRRFLALPGGTAEFALDVAYRPRFLRNALSFILRMPAAAERAPGTLDVIVKGAREIWVRTFPDKMLRSVLWIDGDFLVEEAGPLQFVFSVNADERGLRFSQTSCRLFGRTLPRSLAPRVEVAVYGNERGWNVHIAVAAPGLGRIVTCGGTVMPRS